MAWSPGGRGQRFGGGSSVPWALGVALMASLGLDVTLCEEAAGLADPRGLRFDGGHVFWERGSGATGHGSRWGWDGLREAPGPGSPHCPNTSPRA